MLWFFTLKIRKCLIVLIVLLSALLIHGRAAKKQRYVSLTGCQIITALEYECCANVDLANSPKNEYCFNVKVVPNELTLSLELKIDGNAFYNGKIDPSVAPICPPPSPLCLAVNHVNLANREVCTKLTIGPITLLKFPCVGVQEGQIEVVANNYKRK